MLTYPSDSIFVQVYGVWVFIIGVRHDMFGVNAFRCRTVSKGDDDNAGFLCSTYQF